MFATKSIIATKVLVMALTWTCACLTGYSTNRADNIDEMFPDGLVHDFGKVRSGIQAKHAFRIVNTTDVPLRIVSVRRSG